MSVKSLKIKNESIFYSNDMIQSNNFDSQLLKINKRENRENNNIYYISYKIDQNIILIALIICILLLIICMVR